jgi:hypothetical protein
MIWGIVLSVRMGVMKECKVMESAKLLVTLLYAIMMGETVEI